MKALICAIPLTLLLCLGLCAKEKADPQVIRIWNERMEVVFESTEQKVLDRMEKAFERAEHVDNPKISKSLIYKIDFGIRHQYDPNTGLYRVLSKTNQPALRMLKPDIKYISSLIEE
ncbi:hypothetical protein DDZ13_12995 [Coraliomargarita sinensis]|uniref:Uncharacterized protein n=1 Tax=Coraliomargarita sinensis TaxID=2174842 RepID=A0A317ZGI5_9BACT|nr:hypothetical protein [Coraliomargarita sinensis]PXA03333.1 hypothetical protein DDZ13_12995 [Coraliomargarita sinensis]